MQLTLHRRAARAALHPAPQSDQGSWGGGVAGSCKHKVGEQFMNLKSLYIFDFAGCFWEFQDMFFKVLRLKVWTSLRLKHLNLFHCYINYVFCNVTALA